MVTSYLTVLLMLKWWIAELNDIKLKILILLLPSSLTRHRSTLQRYLAKIWLLKRCFSEERAQSKVWKIVITAVTWINIFLATRRKGQFWSARPRWAHLQSTVPLCRTSSNLKRIITSSWWSLFREKIFNLVTMQTRSTSSKIEHMRHY